MRSGRRLSAWTVCVFLSLAVAPRVSLADGPTPPEPASADVAAAREHFQKARTHYEAGEYRDAISELEAAHQLDPSAKDLVFNLGVVHEKLADIDEALEWFRLYTTMDLTPQEHERADAYLRRLEGAKTEIEQKRAAQQASQRGTQQPSQATPAAPTPSSTPTERVRPRETGRVDAWTLAAAGTAGAALIFGVVMAVKAKTDQPSSDFVTGRDGTYADLSNRVNSSHTEAVVADICFGISAAAGAAAAYLFFARPRDSLPPQPTTGATTVSAGPLVGGGALFVRRSF